MVGKYLSRDNARYRGACGFTHQTYGLHIFPKLLKLLPIMAIFALAAGIAGYFLQGLGMEYYATAIPKQIRHTFYADLWAHEMSYLTGMIGGIILCILVWRSRRPQN